MKKGIFSTGNLTRLAVLVAILLIFCYTPLGRIPLGPIFITLNMIPVVIGAIVLGPTGGAILGVIFGLWSFSTCFGTDAFGTALVNQGFGTAVLVGVMCIVPRFIAGWLPGFIYRWAKKERKLKFEHYDVDGDKSVYRGYTLMRVVFPAAPLASLAGSLINTALFVGAVVLLFAKNPVTAEMMGTADAWTIITLLITQNALFEAIACTVVGGAVGRALMRTWKGMVAV
ncbi:MAG: ECF transporter S component [Oscillospiraceae bacterium]|nr:ECF transporter S component [Oscillospiraceae bacterium]